MGSSALKIRHDFLNSAAQVVSLTSPRIAGYLRSNYQAHGLALASNTTPSTDGGLICTACGGSLVLDPRSNVGLTSKKQPGRTRKDRLVGSGPVKSLNVRCSLCRSSSVIELRAPKTRPKKKASADTRPPDQSKAPTMTPTPSPAPISVQNNSAPATGNARKRPRNRKQGLLEMLASKKASSAASTDLGLDIMDFVKS